MPFKCIVFVSISNIVSLYVLLLLLLVGWFCRCRCRCRTGFFALRMKIDVDANAYCVFCVTSNKSGCVSFHLVWFFTSIHLLVQSESQSADLVLIILSFFFWFRFVLFMNLLYRANSKRRLSERKIKSMIVYLFVFDRTVNELRMYIVS